MIQRFFSLTLVIGLVLSMLASACVAPKASRLTDPNDIKALLVQLVDMEKRAPGIKGVLP